MSALNVRGWFVVFVITRYCCPEIIYKTNQEELDENGNIGCGQCLMRQNTI
jgi:hypothetical protein